MTNKVKAERASGETLVSALIVAALLAAKAVTITAGIGAESDGRLRPYEENPRYWQYQGEPVILLGGSKDDNLYQVKNLEHHLDSMLDVGANYIRNTMSSRDRDDGNLRAFKQLENGKFDLDEWNAEYWERFQRMLELTAEREIFVQIELWDQWDHIDGRWDNDPWNPDRNANYTAVETSLHGNGHYANIRHNSDTRHDLFLTVPELNDDQTVLGYQKQFVDKVLSHSLEYEHVLYTVTNELFEQHPTAWSLYWIQYVNEAAQQAGVDIEITEMFQIGDVTHPQHKASLDNPRHFDYVELSQNSTQTDEQHWERLQWAREYISDHLRPINHTKTYGGDKVGWTDGADHGIERFWRNVIGGAASCRFHRPPAGIGLNKRAEAQIRSACMLVKEINIFRCRPDRNHRLLSGRGDDEAYLTYLPGKQYAVYFPQGGSVSLEVEEGSYALKWLNAEKSKWQEESTVEGSTVELTVPEEGKNWCAVLTADATE